MTSLWLRRWFHYDIWFGKVIMDIVIMVGPVGPSWSHRVPEPSGSKVGPLCGPKWILLFSSLQFSRLSPPQKNALDPIARPHKKCVASVEHRHSPVCSALLTKRTKHDDSFWQNILGSGVPCEDHKTRWHMHGDAGYACVLQFACGWRNRNFCAASAHEKWARLSRVYEVLLGKVVTFVIMS